MENQGQWESSIKFKSDIPGGFLLVKDNSLEYIFYSTQALSEAHGNKSTNGKLIPIKKVTLNFLNSNVGNVVSKSDPEKHLTNYFIGKNPKFWKSNVRSYSNLIIKNLYNNIDFRIYTVNDKLKFEYIVHPKGNPGDIKLVYEGSRSITVNNAEILIETDVNTFKEFNPYTYQQTHELKEIDAHFVLKNNIIKFEIGAYDITQKLIIDPELVFSTYSGSFSDNWSHTATYDNEGNLYAGGSVFGTNFLITDSALQQTLGGALNGNGVPLTTDIVIQKYSSDGSELLYSTFLGGLESEVPHSLVVNSKNQLVIFGTTSSANFPVTETAYDTTFNGGQGISGNPITSNITYRNGSDVFVAVISPNGDKLLGSSYVGGSGNDGINDTRSLAIRNYGDEFRGEVVVDKSDKIYVASVTNSPNFPTSDLSKADSTGAAIAFRLTATCEKLEWSTAIDGINYEAAFSIKVNEENVYICGVTSSSNLAKGTVLKNTFEGSSDGFIANYKGDKLSALTYIGTPAADLSLLLDLDNLGNVYILGLSQGEYPVTDGVYVNKNSGQFIQGLTSDLSKPLFSTVFGSGRGNSITDIVPTAFLVNDCGNMYVSGWGGRVNINTGLNINSSTNNLPTTQNAFKKTTTGSNYYFMILEANARSLLFGSYFGSEAPTAGSERGDHLDGGTCRFDKKGVIYHSACVCRANDFVGFPVKNAFSSTHNSSNCNMAAFKFEIDALVADFNYTDGKEVDKKVFCSNTKLSFNNLSRNAKTYQWFVNGTLISRLEKPTYSFSKEGKYQIKLVSYNNTICVDADSVEKEIQVINFKPSVTSDTTLCPGSSLNLKALGGESYQWSLNVGTENINRPNVQVIPPSSTIYTVQITDGICEASLPINIVVTDEKPDFAISEGHEVCLGDTISLKVSGNFERFVWTFDDKKDSVNTELRVSPNKTTTYNISATYKDGCRPKKATTLRIDTSHAPRFSFAYEYNCNQPAKLTFENTTTNAVSYAWDLGNGRTSDNQLPAENFYSENGKYVISLTTQNAFGCKLVKTLPIDHQPWDGQIPNIITPNGDGKNDVLNIGIVNTTIRILNRWGKLLFYSDNYKNDWGANVKSGTYFYEIILPNKSTCKGYIDVFM
ncbi:MAG: gliding motility-associated-like protein [Spirosomataceae bacterium]